MTPQQLRNSILQQAIEGKLVEQRTEEGTAEDLYAQIQEEKKKLIAEGKIKKEKPFPEITDDEIPFDIPESWKWTRIGELFNVRSARRIHQSDWQNTGIPFFRGRELVRLVDLGDARPEVFISEELYNSLKKFGIPQKDDVLISAVGTLGKTYVIKGDEIFYYKDAYILCIENFGINPYYLKYCIESSFIQHQIYADSMATTVSQLTIEKTKSLTIPLPPREEQKRIVAKIEELLPHVDDYEKAYNALEEYNARFPEDMRKSILQQAIEGKLVEQRKEEGTGEELYAQIQEEKQKLIAGGMIKKEKPLPEITEEEIPFDIPESWKWVRLNEIVSKEIKRGKSPKYTAKSNTLVFAQKCNSKYDGIRTDLALYLDETILDKYSEQEFMLDGDIVINSTGGGTMGRVGQYHIKDNKQSLPIVPDSHITVIRSNVVNISYLFFFLKSQQSFLEGKGDGSTNQTELKPIVLKNLLFPLPPLAEQKRIVAKIEELLPYCDMLKQI